MRLQGSLIALVVAAAALLLPFIDKPFNVDDPLFVWLGGHLQQEPWDFYGFEVNWNGTPEPMHEVTKNPPLTGYFIAAVVGAFGSGERTLHLAFLIPAIAAVLGTHRLASRFCRHPGAAALLAATAPVFLVSATSVMCDVSALALFCWALWTWIEGLERERLGLLVLSGGLAAACALTKYFGASVIGLCFVWGLLQRRRLGAWCAPLGLPVAVLVAYEWGTLAAYGHGLLGDAVGFATGAAGLGKPPVVLSGAVGLVFLGACFAPALFLAPFLWSRWLLLAAAVELVLGVWLLRGELRAAGPFAAMWPSVPLATGMKVQLMAAGLAGASLLAVAALDLIRRRDAPSVLLSLWLGGTFFFASFLNWSNNGRSILPLVPAAAILLVRGLEHRFPAPGPRLQLGLRLAFLPGLAVALAVTWADFRWAISVREEAERLLARHHDPVRPLRFDGHWGFQYYLELGGAHALDLARGEVQADERIAVAVNNVGELSLAGAPVEAVHRLEAPDPRCVRTHSWMVGASFYSSALGMLPFAFGPAAPDEYFVYRALRPFRIRTAADGRRWIEEAAPRAGDASPRG